MSDFNAVELAKALHEKSANGTPVTLPVAGVTIFCRRVHLPSLVAKGHIPADLLRQALSGFPDLQKDIDPDDPAMAGKYTDALIKVREFELAVLTSMMVKPTLVEDNADYEAGEVNYDDLLEEDRNALMGIAQIPVSRWEPFLQEQRERLPVVDNGEESEPEAE